MSDPVTSRTGPFSSRGRSRSGPAQPAFFIGSPQQVPGVDEVWPHLEHLYWSAIVVTSSRDQSPVTGRSKACAARRKETGQRRSPLPRETTPHPALSPEGRGRRELAELGLDGLDLLLAPLDRLLEVHLVGRELGERVHHDELLVDLVRGGSERPRVAGGEVVLGVLLERLELRVLDVDSERQLRVVLGEWLV